MQAELVWDLKATLGEGPLWHHETGRLLFLDIEQGRVHFFNPETGQTGTAYEGRWIGGMTIQRDGSLLLFMDRGGIARLRNHDLTFLYEELEDERETRFNDVGADPMGRVFCGTMESDNRRGRLYRLDLDGKLTEVVPDLGIPNGIGFTPEQDMMYFTHSSAGEILLYDYDRESGAISNPEAFAKVPEEDGVPDGLTVDEEGGVWSARYDGSCIVRYAPDGAEEVKIELPTAKVTSLIFGGPHLDTLYITTAGGDNPDANGDCAGGLFRFEPGVRGRPEYRSAIQF
jgi:D-xylono/L-arabinono-1,4-lactonase